MCEAGQKWATLVMMPSMNIVITITFYMNDKYHIKYHLILFVIEVEFVGF